MSLKRRRVVASTAEDGVVETQTEGLGDVAGGLDLALGLLMRFSVVE